jgi:hypothetical protein
MPFNSLLLPLVGGFLFISFWNKSKYNSKRSNGQRLILESALWGTLFLGIAYIAIRFINSTFPAIYPAWHYLIPYPQLGTPIGSLLIGACLPCILNRVWSEKEQNAKSYVAFSDYLGLVFFKAQLKKKPVMITLRNGKIYVGFIHGCNSPGKHDGGGSLYIQPSLSGYRRHVTHEMYITTDYTAILQKIANPVEQERIKLDTMMQSHHKNKIKDQERQLKAVENAAQERLDDLKMAVSVSDIVSAVIFDSSVYGQFNPMFKP